MESNWRWNVADVGMSLSNWELAARFLDDPSLLLVSDPPLPANRLRLYVIPAPGQLPVAVGFWVRTPPGSRFPAGAAVEPD